MPPKNRKSTHTTGGTRGKGGSKGSKATTPASSTHGTPIPSIPVTPQRSRNPSPAQSIFPRTPLRLTTTYPVLLSPKKVREHREETENISRMTDEEVWDKKDEDILEATFADSTSVAYGHYDISVKRVTDKGPRYIEFVFKCKFGDPKHGVQSRARTKMGDGTGNFNRSMRACEKRMKTATVSTYSVPSIPYSPMNHRILLALQCAASMRPFNMVNDKFYRLQVEMLRPGAELPSSSTIQRDTLSLFQVMSLHVMEYFQKLGNSYHIVLDGWTAPITAAYLGIVIVWHENGNIHRAILDFLRLKKKHTGDYLAQELSKSLKRYQIEKLLLSVGMDNAGNCDKLAEVLPRYIKGFRGSSMRVRCTAHILNLIAKAFMSFFFAKRSTAKSTNVINGNLVVQHEVAGSTTVVDSEFDFDDTSVEDDDGHGIFNHETITLLHNDAVSIMSRDKVTVSARDQKEALQIMPKVSGLARRINDSPTLREEFDKLMEANNGLQGAKRTLSRRVATQWNSDFDCLSSYMHFRKEVQQIIAVTDNNLDEYKLTNTQWDIAKDLLDALEIFKSATELFSQKEVPLIMDVLPLFYDIRLSLNGMLDDMTGDVRPLLKLAAKAALLVLEKYEVLTTESEVYYISIVMCPDRKLQWFTDRNYSETEILKIKKLVIDRFESSYDKDVDDLFVDDSEPETAPPRFVKTAAPKKRPRIVDSIISYLSEELVDEDTINNLGGYMKYWADATKSRPKISRMGLDYCSAPASTVDAERAFSTGRRQINFMQHSMSSNTFRAKMALGSWSNGPLFPGFERVAALLEEKNTNKSTPQSQPAPKNTNDDSSSGEEFEWGSDKEDEDDNNSVNV